MTASVNLLGRNLLELARIADADILVTADPALSRIALNFGEGSLRSVNCVLHIRVYSANYVLQILLADVK